MKLLFFFEGAQGVGHSVDDLVGSNREFAYRYAGLSGVLLTYECEEYLSISTNFAEKAALVSALFLTFAISSSTIRQGPKV